jgi:hypothetical protein
MFNEQNYEVSDVEFDELQELLELSVKDTVESEARETAQHELEILADQIFTGYGDTEEELVENLRYTAQFNPISETALDLRDEAFRVLL